MAKLYKHKHERDMIDFASFSNDLEKIDTTVFKMDVFYSKLDSRSWTALLNQGIDDVMVTYHINKEYRGHQSFDVISSRSIYLDVDPEFIYDVLNTLLTNNAYSYE